MDIVQAITLAFIQGFTEFLPVSSSAHLIVLPKFLDWPDQGLAFDVILHFATLCAVVLYYRSTLVMLGADFSLQLQIEGCKEIHCLLGAFFLGQFQLE